MYYIIVPNGRNYRSYLQSICGNNTQTNLSREHRLRIPVTFQSLPVWRIRRLCAEEYSCPVNKTQCQIGRVSRLKRTMDLCRTFVVTSTFSPFCNNVLMIPTCPYLAAVCILRAPLLFGMCRYTPFLNSIIAQSAWPFNDAMCMRVLPSLVLS